MSEVKIKESAIATVLKKYCKQCKVVEALHGTSKLPNASLSLSTSSASRRKTKHSILFDNIVEQYEVEVQLSSFDGSKRTTTHRVQCVSILRALEDRNSIVGSDKSGKAQASNPSLDFYTQGWIIDASVSSCMTCNKTFSFFNRRHHCRKCGYLICESCSGGRAEVPYIFEGSAGSRVCVSCAKMQLQESARNLNYSVDFANSNEASSFSNKLRTNSNSSSNPNAVAVPSSTTQSLLLDREAKVDEASCSESSPAYNDTSNSISNSISNSSDYNIINSSDCSSINDSSDNNNTNTKNSTISEDITEPSKSPIMEAFIQPSKASLLETPTQEVSIDTVNSDILPSSDTDSMSLAASMSATVISTPLQKEERGPSDEQAQEVEDNNKEKESLTPTTPSMRSQPISNPAPISEVKLSSSLKQTSTFSTSLPKSSILKEIKVAGAWERDSPVSDLSLTPNSSASPNPSNTPNNLNISSSYPNTNEYKTPIQIQRGNGKKKQAKNSVNSANSSTKRSELSKGGGAFSGTPSTPTTGKSDGTNPNNNDNNNILKAAETNGVWEDLDDTSTVASTVRSGTSALSTPLSHDEVDSDGHILSTARATGIWETDTDGASTVYSASTVNTNNNSPMSEFTYSPN